MFEHPDHERQDNDPGAGEPSIEAPTVAAAIAIVATWLDLSCERRGALTSSLRTIARIGETDVALLRLTPNELNSKILGKPSELYGISAPSMATVRSHLRYVMRRLRVLVNRTPFNEPWATLRRRIPARTAVPLTRFFEFHSRAGISPEAVSDATFAECQSWIKNATLCRAPSRLFAQMRYRWNKAARELPDLGLPLLCAARRQTRKTVALEDMHPDLQVDLARMATRLGSCDLDDDFGDADAGGNLVDGLPIDQTGRPAPRRALKPITIDERLRHARQAVWVAVQTGVPLDEIRGLRDLVVPLARAKLIVKFMWTRAGKVRSAPAGHVAEVLRQIAKYHVSLPKEDVDQIAKWQRHVSLQYSEMTQKNRKRLEALLTPEAESKLLALPMVLMKEARELLQVSPVLAISAAKRALLVHLELFYPLRVKNVRFLRRDQHFVTTKPGRQDVARLFIPANEVKNQKTIDRPMLGLTNRYILDWETIFRPLIAAPGNVYLFPGQGVQPMCRQALAASLKKIIAERVGCDVNIHLMRHRAAVAYLKIHPGEFSIVSELLGHTTDKTARKSYTGPERDAAFDRFDQSVLDTMKSIKPKRAPKQRRARPKTQSRHANGAAGPLTSRHRPASTAPTASTSSTTQRAVKNSAPDKPGADGLPSRTEE